jgi:hypothetical protein
MRAPRSEGYRASRRWNLSRKQRALPGCLILVAFALTACGDGITPPPPPPEPELDVSFTLQLNLNNPPMGGECIVTLTAAAKGGCSGAYAEWGALQARILNLDTGRWEDLRPQELHEVFLGERIMTGETQTASLDLERYRRERGQEVLARLQFHWVVNEDGEESIRSATLTAECQ